MNVRKAFRIKSSSRSFVLAGVLSTMLLAAAVQAREWTRFRGPNGSGVSTANIPVTCTEENRNWNVQLPGAGHSSPVVWGNRVYVTTAEEAAGKQHLLCLNTKDGKQLWVQSHAFSPYPHHPFNSFASATPAADADAVYITWNTPEKLTTLAYSHEGKPLWERDLGPFSVNHGGASSPVPVGDLLIVRSDSDAGGPESFVVGLDRKTGEVRWKRPRTGKTGSYSTPILYQPKGRPAEVILTSNAHGMTSLDPKTGEINWELPGIFQQRCVSSPVLIGETIFATAGNGGGERRAVAVQPGAKQPKTEPKVQYQVQKGVPYVPTPVVVGDLLFLWGDGGIVTCVRAATGEQVWMERVGGDFFGSPVCAGGKLYAVSSRGELVVIEASNQFKILGRSELGETSHSTPAVSDGVMYLRTESHLISLGGKK